MVKVNVFVCELNTQSTVAVENWPVSTPTMVTVSACAVAETRAKMLTALNVIRNFRNRDIFPPCTDQLVWADAPSDPARNLAGAMRLHCNLGCKRIERNSLWVNSFFSCHRISIRAAPKREKPRITAYGR